MADPGPARITAKMVAEAHGRRYPDSFWQFYDKWISAENDSQKRMLIAEYSDIIDQYDTWMRDVARLIEQYRTRQAQQHTKKE